MLKTGQTGNSFVLKENKRKVIKKNQTQVCENNKETEEKSHYKRENQMLLLNKHSNQMNLKRK